MFSSLVLSRWIRLVQLLSVFWPITVSCCWVTIPGEVVRGRNRWPEGPGGWAKSRGRESGQQGVLLRSDWAGRSRHCRYCSECSRSPSVGFRERRSQIGHEEESLQHKIRSGMTTVGQVKSKPEQSVLHYSERVSKMLMYFCKCHGCPLEFQ